MKRKGKRLVKDKDNISSNSKKKEYKGLKKIGHTLMTILYAVLYILLNILYYTIYRFLYEMILRNIYLIIKNHFKELCMLAFVICVIFGLIIMKDFMIEFKNYNDNNKKNLDIITEQLKEQKDTMKKQQEETNKKIDEVNNKVSVTSRGGNISRESTTYKVSETKKTSSRSSSSISKEGYATFNVSAYCSCAKCCGKTNGITASGVKAKSGVTIAAPSNYSFGTKIYLEGMGTYVVQDRGGAIKGNKIDVYFDSHEEALRFGRKNIKGRVVQ